MDQRCQPLRQASSLRPAPPTRKPRWPEPCFRRGLLGSGKAILSWDRYYPGFTYKESRNLTATTWQSINELGAAGWTIHAPASAMPRERTAATEKALRFVIHRPPGG